MEQEGKQERTQRKLILAMVEGASVGYRDSRLRPLILMIEI
jgi:hypothetical protein